MRTVTIKFPESVTVTKCITRSHSLVYPTGFISSHGAHKKIITTVNHDVEISHRDGRTSVRFINPELPMVLSRTVIY